MFYCLSPPRNLQYVVVDAIVSYVHRFQEKWFCVVGFGICAELSPISLGFDAVGRLPFQECKKKKNPGKKNCWLFRVHVYSP